VLATDTPRVQIVLPEGTFPQWSAEQQYMEGDTVLVNRVPYVASWWSQGALPSAVVPDGEQSPWRIFTADEVTAALLQAESVESSALIVGG
jgi:chitinase